MESSPPASLEHSIPGRISVQIIPASSLISGGVGPQIVTAVSTDQQQGATQSLLNIAQTDQFTNTKVDLPVNINELVDIPVDVEGTDSDGLTTEVDDEAALEEEKKKVAEDIRQQIRELCNQLADVGEESFLVSVRVLDGTCDHVGSIKGDHFCLLRQEMVDDFHKFCMGIEDTKPDDEVEEDFPKFEDSLDNDDGEETKQEENMEIDVEELEPESEAESELKPPGPRPGVPVTPKVIVLKKDADGKKITVDHQYTVKQDKVKPKPDIPVDKETTETKQTTSILFLCDICKNVYNNIKELREHKLQVHDEGDYLCEKCPRIFSLKKVLDRHMMDAHGTEEDEDEKYICDSCVLEFPSKEELHEHIKVHHDYDMPMKCDVCEQNFPEISKLMDHRKIHFDYDCFCHKCWQGFFDYLELETHNQTNCRYKEALYKCDICGKRYTKLSAINKHIDTHPIHSPHVCRMCGRGFESEKDLKYHRTAAHIVRPFKCEFCSKTFKKKDTLIEHRRIHLRVKIFSTSESSVVPMNVLMNELNEGDSLRLEKRLDTENCFECNICGIVLSSQNTLDQHMHQHETATEEHKCDRCDRVFFSHSLLTVHCRKEHKIFLNSKIESKSSGVGPLACEWEGCNKTFYDSSKWKYHMKYHEARADKIARGIPLTPQQSVTSCEICGKVLKYKSYLKAHMLTHSKEQPHQCEICGQAYSNQRRLEDHLRVHKGEKPFRCRVCDKAFTSTSLRNQHMVVHWGHKTYICDVCGKGFMSRKHFHDHMRIHNGEQPHKCDACGKDFIYYRSLVRHALTHIDPKERPKPYKCQYCGKEYTEVTGYKHHLRSVHTGETPFQCDICGDAFHRNDKLKRHMKSRHGKAEKQALKGLAPGMTTHIVTTRRTNPAGAPIIIKTETEQRDDLFQIIQDGQAGEGEPNELHVDVIQQETGPQQVFLIGLGNEGGETTFLQETQVIEGPDGVRYIIAGSGEELQVIESTGAQQFQDAQIIEGDIYSDIDQGSDNVMIMNDGQTYSADQETLTTLANMASVVEGTEPV